MAILSNAPERLPEKKKIDKEKNSEKEKEKRVLNSHAGHRSSHHLDHRSVSYNKLICIVVFRL